MLSPGQGTALTKSCPLCGRSYHYSERHSCPAGPVSDPIGERPSSNPGVEDESDPILGAVLGDRYLMLSRLSRGGMGVVYKARHVLLDTAVAVKILLEQQDQVAQMRFLQEAKLASRIKHPNTVYISDFGVLDDGRSYLVMELLRGPTLGRVLRDGPMQPERACKIAAQIATGLQAVHDRGIVHRELKPLCYCEAGRRFSKTVFPRRGTCAERPSSLLCVGRIVYIDAESPGTRCPGKPLVTFGSRPICRRRGDCRWTRRRRPSSSTARRRGCGLWASTRT